MAEISTSERAEKLSRRRARMFPILALFFLSQQISYFTQPHTGRPVDQFRVGAWLVLSLVLLAALATKGSWFREQKLRDLLNDETTRANRASAMSFGFVAAILTAILVYFANQFAEIRGDEAAHVIVTFGIGVALLRFGMLEKRAHRDG